MGRTFFIAGIIQGSLHGKDIHGQDYRERLRELLRERFPEDVVYCPFEEFPESVEFDEAKARATFMELMRRAGEADVLIAFLPQASMGTAIELWRAYHAGTWVFAVSEMNTNWVVRFLADEIFPDLETFEQFVRSGELAERIAQPPRRPEL